MVKGQIADCIKDIQKRHYTEGGFAEKPGGLYRPDATAWAVMALTKTSDSDRSAEFARDKLKTSQLKDGRVCMPGDNDALWPTPLAVLAWQGSQQHIEAQGRAVKFLLKISSVHWGKRADSASAHDTSIRGWAWTKNTHSWIEPTALALIALEVTAQMGHSRFQEGIRMIMDRQLPHGGWNYGNTFVYGQELHPFIDTTGIALSALAGHVAKEDVNRSILFLKSRIAGCRTPLSLGWALFGLGAWGEFPREGNTLIENTLKRQEKFGIYGTSLLSLLTLASICQGNFRKCVA